MYKFFTIVANTSELLLFILACSLQVNVTLKKSGKLEHQGIKIEFIGQIGKLDFFICLL